MSEDNYRKIFVKKLSYYMNKHNKNQADLINELNISSATISSWCTGKKLPRMDKIQLLADYFGIEKSDLLEEKKQDSVFLSDYPLSDIEKRIIAHYRKADAVDKEMVHRILHIEAKENKEELA